jgi:hypothetical protein
LTARPAGAQTAQPVAGFQDGFFIQSPDGDTRLVVGLIPVSSTVSIRKLRPTFSGRVARYFDVRVARAFRVRIGKDKTPIGHELLQGDADPLFPERALASSLVPNRDIGVQEVTGSYVLTGEAASDRGGRPRDTFDPQRATGARCRCSHAMPA